MYQGRDFSQTNEEGNNLQKPLMPVFEGIADFLGLSAKYYQRSSSLPPDLGQG